MLGSAPIASPAQARLRPVRLGTFGVAMERRVDGALLLRATTELGAYARHLGEPLEHWARAAPERLFLAQRDANGAWRTVTYARALEEVRRIAAALLARHLSPERPIAIISGNDIEHALLALAAMYAGIPYAPISPAYSLMSSDFGKLRAMIELLTPGLVLANDGAQFARAIEKVIPAATEVVVTRNPSAARATTLFTDLVAKPEASLGRAHAAVNPDTIAKLLFTSGSTGTPKAVINTQRMLCSNQAMIAAGFRFVEEEPPVTVDWLPWSHTFGGNHNIGLTLHNGGSMYLDQGKPMPGGIEETVRNLREISPTVYFNVPKGYESLLPYLRDDGALREQFFARLHAMFFAGAALSQFVWDSLDELSVQATGRRVPMLTGLGATESGPFFMSVNPRTSRSGHVGLPVSGNVAKLVPTNGKLEVCASGPNVTPGYWRAPELTREAFDEEGFYRFGDALKPADADDLDAGFDFDGRIAEDFKLASGTWVSVGPLRARFIAACAPLVRDVVIAGINRDEISAIVVLDLDGCRLINPTLPSDDIAATAADRLVRGAFAERFARLLATATGSSTRIARAILLDTPLSIDRGEVTDKGSVNQRAVLQCRGELIEELYSPAPPEHVIVLG